MNTLSKKITLSRQALNPIFKWLNMPKIFGIYSITNTINGNRYIGSTCTSFIKRWTDHRSRLRRNVHYNPHLQHAWNYYGSDVFVFEILETIELQSLVLEREQYWLDKFRAEGTLYNHLQFAANWVGHHHTDETKKKISLAKVGLIHPDSVRLQMSASHKGKTLTDEHKKNISLAKSGIPISEEARQNRLGKNKGEKHYNYGKARSEEVKRRISESQIGILKSDEHRKKLSASKIGKPWSEARKASQERRRLEKNTKDIS